jgi:sulfoxide reductase catalytic subunit YedY
MLIKRRRGWEITESEATPESVFLDRRAFVSAGIGLAGAALLPGAAGAAPAPDPTADLYPAKRNETFKLDRAITAEKFAGSYNNYYEFGTSKKRDRRRGRAQDAALEHQDRRPRRETDRDRDRRPHPPHAARGASLPDALREAWSMAVPWTGFPLKSLVELAKPTSGAKYIVMRTFMDRAVAPGQKQFWYPWPYTEGLTLAEANNDLTMLVTGVYGKPLGNQYGAPIRLIVPWKYGFKGVKAINSITFSAERPKNLWEGLQGGEYGFWANVNPEVSHPR